MICNQGFSDLVDLQRLMDIEVNVRKAPIIDSDVIAIIVHPIKIPK